MHEIASRSREGLSRQKSVVAVRMLFTSVAVLFFYQGIVLFRAAFTPPKLERWLPSRDLDGLYSRSPADRKAIIPFIL